jgi:hypothetical protein
MQQKILLFLCCGILFIATACNEKDPFGYNGPGKAPVYMSINDFEQIGNGPAQSIDATGTIFLLDSLLFMVEQYKGIHVLNVKDSLNVGYLTFIRLPAVRDFTLAWPYLYADSWRDLVTLDLSDLQQVKVTNRLKDVVNPPLFPPQYRGYFECVDERKGVLVGWVDAELEFALCSTEL